MAAALAPAWWPLLRLLVLLLRGGRDHGIVVWLHVLTLLWTASSFSFLWLMQAPKGVLYEIALAVAWPMLLVAIVADVASPAVKRRLA